MALGGWIAFVVRRVRSGDPLPDPLAARAGAEDPVAALLDAQAVLPAALGVPLRTAIATAAAAILADDLTTALAA